MSRKGQENRMDWWKGIEAVSYIGEPQAWTAMFVTAKSAQLLEGLKDLSECLVFAEEGMAVPDALLAKHHFAFSKNPQLAYYHFSLDLARKQAEKDSRRSYRTLANGARVGENVSLGQGVVIEAFALVDHDCQLGDRVHIGAGAVVKRAKLADAVQLGPHTVIGADGYNLVKLDGNTYSQPTLGSVEVGRSVVIGSQVVVAAGLAGVTRIGDYSQVDSLCHIHHDCQIGNNVELCSSVSMGGFCQIADDSFIGIGCRLKNRIKIGRQVVLGMGSVLLTDLPDGVTAFGSPAKVRPEQD